jgi:DNA polymerase III epsilon subunit-like protein
MSVAWKFLGDKDVSYMEVRDEHDYMICKVLHSLLDEADFVVAHNLKKFDLPKINTRMIYHSFDPYSPVKMVDTLEIAKKKFGFSSNKLEYLAKFLGVTPKLSHSKFVGHELWNQCLKGNDEAWDEMREYNIGDVVTLEGVYKALSPWAGHLHPSVAPYDEQSTRDVCPKCGSHHIQYRGYATTNQNKYARFQCNSCGGWGRSTKRVKGVEKQVVSL